MGYSGKRTPRGKDHAMTITRRDTFKYAGAAIAVMSGARAASAGTRAESNAYAVRSGPMPVPYVPRRGYADGPFGQVHFRDTGEGRPLVLCPQAPMTSRQFENVYKPLARRGIRAIGVDSPGFGESDPTPFVPTASDWAEAVPAVLDQLGIEKADVLGHHAWCSTNWASEGRSVLPATIPGAWWRRKWRSSFRKE